MKKRRLLIVLSALWLFYLAPDASAFWSAVKRLTWTSGESDYPAIATDSNKTIHLVWNDDTPGNSEIHYKRSTDGGTSWSAAKRLTWTSDWSRNPAIAIDTSNVIHIVWSESISGGVEIFYKRSLDGGATWGPARRLTWTSGWSYEPAIAVYSNNAIHVVWWESWPDYYEIYYKRSTDGGSSWGAVERLTWTPGNSYLPAVAADSNQSIYVVWYDDTPGYQEIYFKKSPNGGSTWNPVERLTWISEESRHPRPAVDSNNALHFVWYVQTPEQAEIHYRRSPNGGSTWSPDKRLTWTSGWSQNPDIAVGAGNSIHVVWTDDTPGNHEVYYKGSPDGGLTWSLVQRLTWTLEDSWEPAIAVDSTDFIHIVWRDDTAGNAEIYYKNSK